MFNSGFWETENTLERKDRVVSHSCHHMDGSQEGGWERGRPHRLTEK